MNNQVILKISFDNKYFINRYGEPYKKYYYELIDKKDIKITQTIKIQNYLTNEEAQNKINKNLIKLIKSYIKLKNENLHLYK